MSSQASPPAAPATSDQDRSELLRLRNQAAQLTQGTNEMQRLRTQVQQLQERYRANNPTYAATIAAASAPTTSPEKHYALAIPAAAASGYTITATAQASSPQFGDTRCRFLSIKMDGGTMSTSSANATGTVDNTNANRCWVK